MSGYSGQGLRDFSMLDLFVMEVQTHATALQTGLDPALSSSDPLPLNTISIEPLMRAAHSIKGAARIVQLDAPARIATLLEDCFVATQDGSIQPGMRELQVLQQAGEFLRSLGDLSSDQLENYLASQTRLLEPLIDALTAVLTGSEPQIFDPLLPPDPFPDPLPPPPVAPPVVEDPSVDFAPEPDLSNLSMLELFRMEVETQSGVLNDGLLQLENNPDAVDLIEPLMRAAHSVKGAARIVQLDHAVQVAHVMEDCFVAAQDGKIQLGSDDIDLMFRGVDMLSRISQVPAPEMPAWNGSHQAEIKALIANISRVLVAPQDLKDHPAAYTPDPIRATGKAVQETKIAPDPQPAIPGTIASNPTQETLATTPEPVAPLANRGGSERPTATSESTNERVVRVSTDNLNRLMGLAGESLVEANWLQPFADSLLKLKTQQLDLVRILDKLDESLSLKKASEVDATSLKTARQKANHCHQILSDRIGELELFARRNANLSDRLYREVIATHMRPFADGVQAFPRMVRDLAKQLGKQVKFEILGKSTPVDRDILEKLEAPLTHILRNAIDHGIELPQERQEAGKPPAGSLRLEAAHRAGMLSITIADDGRGVKFEQLRQKILTKGLATPQMVSQMSESELVDFLFLPGFSTAKQVTEISGRGVGLDVVQTMVQQVGGMLRAVSQPGKSMTFHLQLPLTLSVIRTLLVEISGEPYAFPLTRIDHIVTLSKSEIEVVENRQYFNFDGHNVGLIVACQVLDLDESQLNLSELAVIVLSDRQHRYGLVVDQFLGERDLVVRPLDPRLGKVKNISAAALMEDGPPVLIVDIEDLVRSIDQLLEGGGLSQVSRYEDQAHNAKMKRVLVVDDSLTVREVERKLLENNGYQVDVCVNGVDGWNAIRTASYDLVITDVDMPRMNGIELVGQIKNHPTLKSVPVIIVSYKDREEDRLRGLEVGADYYLTKSSFHDNTLLNAVIDLIGRP